MTNEGRRGNRRRVILFGSFAAGPLAEARAQQEAKAQNYRFDKEMKKRIVEIAVKVVVAALTAFLTAITTTSCMGHGPILL